MPKTGYDYGAFALRTLGTVLRVCAIVMCILITLLCFPTGPLRQLLLAATTFADGLVPAPLAGLFVFLTPFGGAFRGDYAIVAVALFALDYVCQRGAHALGQRRSG